MSIKDITNKNIKMAEFDELAFQCWMNRVMERFDNVERAIASLVNKEYKEVKHFEGERLMDNQDLCELLQTSKRSLQRYRSSGTLKYQMLWHKVYYKESDVQDFLRYHFNEFKKKRAK